MFPRMLAALAAAWGAAAQAGELRLCTDRGGLLATEADDGSLEGALHLWTVRGTRDALELVDARGDVIWRGPLASLEPGPAPRIEPAAVARRFAALVPGLTAKGASVRGLGFEGEVGADGALRGAWSDGTVVAYALGLGGDGLFGGPAPEDAPLGALPGASAPSSASDPLTGARPASLAAALGRLVTDRLERAGTIAACPLGGPDRLWVGAWPQPIALTAGQTVTWTAEEAALVRSPSGSATLYRAVPEAGGLGLDIAEIALGPLPPAGPTTGDPIHGPGRELAAQLDARRAALGLEPLLWDDTLAWSALSQCADLDATAAAGLDDGPSRQERGSDPFVGERAPDGADAIAIVGRSGASPWAVVDRWLEDPRRRGALLDPRAARVGACATPGGARVVEVSLDPSRPMAARTVPADGSAAVPVAWVAEGGSPLPEGLTSPMGSALSAWVDGGASARVVSTRLETAGRPVPHVVIATRSAEDGVAAVHLVPRAPYRPDTAYRWEVVLAVGDELRVVRRRFRTAPEAAAVAP